MAAVGGGGPVTAVAARPSAYDALRAGLLEELEAARADHLDAEAVRRLATDLVRRYQRRAHLGDARALAEPARLVDRLVASVASPYGVLTEPLSRPHVVEVYIEDDEVSYLDDEGGLHVRATPTSAEENRAAVERLLGETDRRLDATSPLVVARVLGGRAGISRS